MNNSMTPWEIKRDYLAGKNPLQMLTCLADQNGCSKKDIAAVLIREGVPVDRLPKNYRARFEEGIDMEEARTGKPVEIPAKDIKEPEYNIKLTHDDAGLVLGVLMAYISERSEAIASTPVSKADEAAQVLDTVGWMSKAANIARVLTNEMHKG